ncbi:MAG: bifunctional glutamate N-acetyltransferase/amino-acid acetyltransferase ArgJ [Acidimicrobiales bacterium]
MSVTAARGFVAAGGAVGIKASGAADLAVVATTDGRPVTAAGTFTQNLALAGPVRVSQRHLVATGGRAAAVVLNSGNANCATGDDVAVAEAMAAATAQAVGCQPTEVLVCSTGLIGIPLDVAVVTAGIAAVAPSRSVDGAHDAAVALMTTDTRPKEAVATSGACTVGGMAKGAAMLAPQMAVPHATMLAVLTTDADLDAPSLAAALAAAVDASFNRVVVDGCTSTNDTVLLLASGAAGPPADPDAFAALLGEVCTSLARQMAEDAEGHTKVVTVEITGAADDAEADRAARALATSLLVKCSFHGSDPYWGRVLSDLGTAGVAVDVDALTIAYGGQVVSRGLGPCTHDAAAVRAAVESPAFTLACDLGAGAGAAWVLTNDLSHAYVDENMGTS